MSEMTRKLIEDAWAQMAVINYDGGDDVTGGDSYRTIESLIGEVKRLQSERDRLREALSAVADKFEYLEEVWGAENITRRVIDGARQALAGPEADESEDETP